VLASAFSCLDCCLHFATCELRRLCQWQCISQDVSVLPVGLAERCSMLYNCCGSGAVGRVWLVNSSSLPTAPLPQYCVLIINNCKPSPLRYRHAEVAQASSLGHTVELYLALFPQLCAREFGKLWHATVYDILMLFDRAVGSIKKRCCCSYTPFS
jgi:hypothetical protein